MSEIEKGRIPKSTFIRHSILYSIYITSFLFVGIIIPVLGFGMNIGWTGVIIITIVLYILILSLLLNKHLKDYNNQFLSK